MSLPEIYELRFDNKLNEDKYIYICGKWCYIQIS